MSDALDRRLGLIGSAAIGVSSMIGAGLFVVLGPAVAAAGGGVLIALAIAAVIAACNAVSSARLARVYPVSGGTYVYGRERLGPGWGLLAGWAFVTGKLASCAVMALAVGTYAWPEHARPVALALVAAVACLNLAGVEKSSSVAVLLVAIVLVVLAIVVIVLWTSPRAVGRGVPTSSGGILEASGLLFFAFAGYARLATLGEEVRRPQRTIPYAIAIAVSLVVATYAASTTALLHVLGEPGLAASSRPFVTALDAAGAGSLTPVLIVTAALAAAAALLSLMLGVSRTVLAMARDRHLPDLLTRVGTGRRVPWAAELVVAAAIVPLVLLGGFSGTVAFSSCCVLLYYAIANASALTLPGPLGWRVVAALGLVGCVVVAVALLVGTT